MKYLVILVTLNFCITYKCWGQTPSILKKFSSSSQWLKLLYIENGKTSVESERYFLSTSDPQKLDPLEELQASLKAFKNREKNPEGFHYQCLFPARFKILKDVFPNEFTQFVLCKDFNEWKSGVDAGRFYLVFSSSYPNNPASMFGHTFLRSDRSSKGQSENTKSILGYSFAFQAQTTNEDNPLVYTFKGLFGGYPAFLEVKPHYIDIGIYNNQESRDLWEFPLELKKSEKDLLIAHLWELSHSVYYNYYFFDENCSTYILKILEVLRPEIDFESGKDLFVVPQKTMIDIYSDFGKENIVFKPSIKRKINHQIDNLSKERRDILKKSLHTNKNLKTVKDPRVLDTIIDYWKYQNYKHGTNIKKEESDLLFTAMKKRSQVRGETIIYKFDKMKNQNPLLLQGFHKLQIFGGRDFLGVNTRYGFSSFFDNPVGKDKNSYITFSDLSYLKEENKESLEFKLIEILSLQKFRIEMKDFSWRVKNYYLKEDSSTSSHLFGGVGISSDNSFMLIGGEYIDFEEKRLIPKINIGSKFESNSYLFGIDYFYSLFDFDLKNSYSIQFKRFMKSYSFGIESRQSYLSHKNKIFIDYYF